MMSVFNKSHSVRRLFPIALIAMACVSTAIAQIDPDASAEYYEDALIRYDKEEYEAAVIQLKNSLQQDPENLPARILLGNTHLKLARPAAAAKELQLARRQGGDDQLVLIPLATAYLLLREFDTLLREFEPGNRPPELEAGIRVLRGQAHLELRELDDAESAFGDARALKPDNLGAVLGQASVRLQRGDPEGAQALVSDAVEFAPNRPEVWFMAGEVLRSKRDLQGALAEYDKAIALAPDYLAARNSRATVLIALAELPRALADTEHVRKLDPNNPQAAYLHALVLSRTGDLDGAKAVFEELSETVLGRQPSFLNQHAPSLLLAGYIHYQRGNYEEAHVYLRRYLDLYPRHTGAQKLLSSTLIRIGEPFAAIDGLERALRIAPNDAGLYVILGNAYMQAKQFSRANRAFEKAAELAPTQAAIRAQLATSRLALGRPEEAIVDLESALALDSDSRRPSILLGQIYLRQGRYDEALRMSADVRNRDPTNPTAYNMAGGAYLGTGDIEAAIASFNRALELDPGFMPARLNLAALDTARGRLEAAKARYESVREIDPDNTGAMAGLADVAAREGRYPDAIALLEELRSIDPSAVQEQVRLVRLYVKQEDVDAALSTAGQLKAAHPDNVAVLLALGEAQLAAGRRDHAAGTFRRVSRLAGHSTEQLHVVATYQLKAGDEEGARWSLQKAVQGNADFLPAHEALVRMDMGEGRLDEALSQAARLRERHPQSARPDVLTGDVLMLLGRHDEAAKAYAMAQKKEDSPNVALRLFQAKRRGGNIAEGLKELEDRVRVHPDDQITHMVLATAYIEAGRYAQATAHHEALLGQRLGDPMLLNNLAWLYQRAGDARALSMAERAYQRAPDVPTVLDTYGWILVENGEAARGLKYLRDAHSRQSDDPTIRYHLAVALFQLGRMDEARRELERALASSDDFEEASEARALLRDLSGS